MQAGDLRHRVTIQALPAEVGDGHGGFTDGTLSVVASRLSALVETLDGRELERALQIDPRASHRVTLRFRRDVTSRQQVVFHDPDRGDRTFEIAKVLEGDNSRRELQLLCKEKAA